MFGIPNKLHETQTFFCGGCYDDQFQTTTVYTLSPRIMVQWKMSVYICSRQLLGGRFMLFFRPYLGKIPILTVRIFFKWLGQPPTGRRLLEIHPSLTSTGFFGGSGYIQLSPGPSNAAVHPLGGFSLHSELCHSYEFAGWHLSQCFHLGFLAQQKLLLLLWWLS